MPPKTSISHSSRKTHVAGSNASKRGKAVASSSHTQADQPHLSQFFERQQPPPTDSDDGQSDEPISQRRSSREPIPPTRFTPSKDSPSQQAHSHSPQLDEQQDPPDKPELATEAHAELMRGRVESHTTASAQQTLHIFFMAFLGDETCISEVVGDGDCGFHALLKGSGLVFDQVDREGQQIGRKLGQALDKPALQFASLEPRNDRERRLPRFSDYHIKAFARITGIPVIVAIHSLQPENGETWPNFLLLIEETQQPIEYYLFTCSVENTDMTNGSRVLRDINLVMSSQVDHIFIFLNRQSATSGDGDHYWAILRHNPGFALRLKLNHPLRNSSKYQDWIASLQGHKILKMTAIFANFKRLSHPIKAILSALHPNTFISTLDLMNCQFSSAIIQTYDILNRNARHDFSYSPPVRPPNAPSPRTGPAPKKPIPLQSSSSSSSKKPNPPSSSSSSSSSDSSDSDESSRSRSRSRSPVNPPHRSPAKPSASSGPELSDKHETVPLSTLQNAMRTITHAPNMSDIPVEELYRQLLHHRDGQAYLNSIGFHDPGQSVPTFHKPVVQGSAGIGHSFPSSPRPFVQGSADLGHSVPSLPRPIVQGSVASDRNPSLDSPVARMDPRDPYSPYRPHPSGPGPVHLSEPFEGPRHASYAYLQPTPSSVGLSSASFSAGTTNITVHAPSQPRHTPYLRSFHYPDFAKFMKTLEEYYRMGGTVSIFAFLKADAIPTFQSSWEYHRTSRHHDERILPWVEWYSPTLDARTMYAALKTFYVSYHREALIATVATRFLTSLHEHA